LTTKLPLEIPLYIFFEAPIKLIIKLPDKNFPLLNILDLGPQILTLVAVIHFLMGEILTNAIKQHYTIH
jgi:hypothetical protein